VGNQAVQEIAAGKAHEQAYWAAVVTNNRYTSAAEQLAATNGILLLHYSDLPNLDAILQAKFAGQSLRQGGTSELGSAGSADA
jgi:restriction system protein